MLTIRELTRLLLICLHDAHITPEKNLKEITPAQEKDLKSRQHERYIEGEIVT